jgi:hypothetical protein
MRIVSTVKSIFFLLVVTLALTKIGCHKKPGDAILADYIVEKRLTTNIDSQLVRGIVDTMLFNSKWSDKIQINRFYDENLLNIYLINGEESNVRYNGLTSKISGNCYYAGNRIMFLDVAYLESFLRAHNVTPDPDNVFLIGDQKCLFYWAIGHELGHFICGHLDGHFDAGSLDHFVKTSTISNKEEMQADSFFVHVIVSRKKLLSSEERLMENMLNSEIVRKIGPVSTYGVGIIYDYTNVKIVNYAKQRSHPEYVIRLSRMLELSSKQSGDKGLELLTGGFIRQLKEVK